MKRFFLSILIIIIASLFWIAGFPFPYLLNNYRLDSFADQLNGIPLPPQTKKIGPLVKKFGNLGPCGKHGDYYTEFKIFSSLSLIQLKRFYEQFHAEVPGIDNPVFSIFRGLGTNGPQDIEVKKVDGEKSKYIVSVFDPDYWHNDLRCW